MERYDIKTEGKLLKAINKLLPEHNEMTEEEVLNLSEVAIMTPCNVCMFIAKTERSKRLLSRFVLKESNIKVPVLSYDPKGSINNITSKYSTEYLKNLMDLFVLNGAGVKLSIMADYPITLEDNDFKVILAPRLEND